ncbi:hypothetical protein HanHA89_Chr13g0501851 [Helianthus annuus]|nr:hypothetical protein HanHA89_Chr13g0501851 [Helianthus annuus]
MRKQFPLPLPASPCAIVSLFLPSRICWLLLPSLLWRSCSLLWCFLSSENCHLNVYSMIVTQSNNHNYCRACCQIAE